MVTIDGLNYYTVPELTKKYKLKKYRIYIWIQRNQIDSIKVGHMRLIAETDVPTFLRQKT